MSLENIILNSTTIIEEELKTKGSYEIKKYSFKQKNFNIELYYGIRHKILKISYNTKNNKYNITILYNNNSLEYKTTLEEEKIKKLLYLSKKILERNVSLKSIIKKVEEKNIKNFYYGYDIINKEYFEIFYSNTNNFKTIIYTSKKNYFEIIYNYKTKKYSYKGKIPFNITKILEEEKVSDKYSFIEYFKKRTVRKIKKAKKTLEELFTIK